MKQKFSTFNSGKATIVEDNSQPTDFAAPVNTVRTSDTKTIVKLAYDEKSKRDEDIQFAESRGRSLSIKIKTRLVKDVNTSHKAIIGNTLYSIIKLDHDTTKGEMYFYLEEERKLK